MLNDCVCFRAGCEPSSGENILFGGWNDWEDAADIDAANDADFSDTNMADENEDGCALSFAVYRKSNDLRSREGGFCFRFGDEEEEEDFFFCFLALARASSVRYGSSSACRSAGVRPAATESKLCCDL